MTYRSSRSPVLRCSCFNALLAGLYCIRPLSVLSVCYRPVVKQAYWVRYCSYNLTVPYRLVFRLHGMHAMHEMQPIVTNVRGVCPSVCLSRGSTRLHCAKTAEWIKMLFWVNTFGSPRDIVLHGGPDPPTDKVPTFKLSDPLVSPEWLKLETWNFACIYTAADPIQKATRLFGGPRRGHVTYLNSTTAYLSQKRIQLQSPARAVCEVHSMQPLPSYFGLLFQINTVWIDEFKQLTTKYGVVSGPIQTSFNRNFKRNNGRMNT